MRYVRLAASDSDSCQWGVQTSDGFFRSNGRMLTLEEITQLGTSEIKRVFTTPVEVSSLHPPIEPSSKIIGVGLNYADHARQGGFDVPARPVLFGILSSAAIGPRDDIVLPPGVKDVDWEAELALVIGRSCRNVSPESALDFVAGFAAANDVSARADQIIDGQWTRAKSFDSFKPLGPGISPTSELGDGSGLSIQLWVNGNLKQSSSTSELVFGARDLVSWASFHCTLNPGDVILTGTPAGTGSAQNPPEYLRHDDVVTVEIEGVGSLENRVRNYE